MKLDPQLHKALKNDTSRYVFQIFIGVTTIWPATISVSNIKTTLPQPEQIKLIAYFLLHLFSKTALVSAGNSISRSKIMKL